MFFFTFCMFSVCFMRLSSSLRIVAACSSALSSYNRYESIDKFTDYKEKKLIVWSLEMNKIK